MTKVNVYCDQRKHGDCTGALETIVCNEGGSKSRSSLQRAEIIYYVTQSPGGGHELSLDILARGQS